MLLANTRLPHWSLIAVGGLLVAAGAALMLSEDAEAGHYRGGSLWYEPTGERNEVVVHGAGHFTKDWGAWSPEVGSTVANGIFRMDWGDGSAPTDFDLEVLFTDESEDWWVGRIVEAGTADPGLVHKYPSPDDHGDPWKLRTFESNCRAGKSAGYEHINNYCTRFQLEASVDLVDDPGGSPRIYVPPIWACDPGSVCRVPLADPHDPEGDPAHLRYATSMEASGRSNEFVNPGLPGRSDAPSVGGRCCGQTGAGGFDGDWWRFNVTESRWEWDTRTTMMSQNDKTLYTVAVMAEGKAAKAPAEWMVELAVTDPPVWAAPQTPCRPDAHPLAAEPGRPVSYTVRAVHFNRTKPIDVFVSPVDPLPAGAELTWSTPQPNPEEVEGTVTWTPPADAQPGELVTTVFYGHIGSHYAWPCAVQTIISPPAPRADFACTDLGSQDAGRYGQMRLLDRTELPELDYRGYGVQRSWQFNDQSGYQDVRSGSDPSNSDERNVWQAPEYFTGRQKEWRVALEVVDPWGQKSKVVHMCQTYWNHAPVLQEIGDQHVQVGDALDLDVLAWDPDAGDRLRYEHDLNRTLPWDAKVQDFGTRFHWTPDTGDGGLYRDNRFTVTDGERTASETVAIRVQEGTAGGGRADRLDGDGDGVPTAQDNCPHTPNADQRDLDKDETGDACDPDIDGDGVGQFDAAGGRLDNCPYLFNPDQEDDNGDGVGDACQGDFDTDGAADAHDVCPTVHDPDQATTAGVGDACREEGALASAPEGVRQAVAEAQEPVGHEEVHGGAPEDTGVKVLVSVALGAVTVFLAAGFVGVAVLARRPR